VLGSPRSGELSTKVGVDSALRDMVGKGSFTTPKHIHGVDHAVVCLSVVLSYPHERHLAL